MPTDPRPTRKPVVFDNREAMAYMIFRRFNCSRDEALSAIDELSAMFRSIKRIAEKRWRSPRAK